MKFVADPHSIPPPARLDRKIQNMSQAPAPDQVDKDVDELDDFEESDDDTTEFRVRDPLNPPTANLFSTKTLHSTFTGCVAYPLATSEHHFVTALIHEGLIDLNPAYQRGKFLES